MQLMRQFKPGDDWTLNDHFTIPPHYLEQAIAYTRKFFSVMLSRMNQHQNQVAGQRSGAPSGAPTTQPIPQNTMPALNASNLQQLQQQEEALQRARRASSQTAVAVNTAVPPAPFGAPSPQGVPHAYGPASNPPQELKLPLQKKRKQAHAAATVPSAAAAAAAKTNASQPGAGDATLIGAFRCEVPECLHHSQGFPTQHALDYHVAESHQAEEPIGDPLEFALESFRIGLMKEDKEEGAEAKVGPAPPMDTPQLSSKQEAITPATLGATPMGRPPSQFGVKGTSPASSQQLTPRGPAAKGLAAATPKAAAGKEGKKEPGKSTDPTPATATDPWATSAISLEAIQDAFMDLGDDGGLGLGPMEEFLNADMFAPPHSKDTPDSVETGVVTQTPKDTELPKTDDLTGKMVDAVDDQWMDWPLGPTMLDDGMFPNQSWDDIDWEMMDRQDGGLGMDDGRIAIRTL